MASQGLDGQRLSPGDGGRESDLLEVDGKNRRRRMNSRERGRGFCTGLQRGNGRRPFVRDP
jgi:hypothetical protein